MSNIPPRPWRVLEGEPDFFYVAHDGPGMLCTSYGPFDRDFAHLIVRLVNAEAQVVEFLESIAHAGTDCPAAMDPESFYRYQLHTMMHRATSALALLRGDRPAGPFCSGCGASLSVDEAGMHHDGVGPFPCKAERSAGGE